MNGPCNTRPILLALATTRLIGLVVRDDLGHWAIRQPAHHWAHWDGTTDPTGWRQKLVSGLDCPWCVGTWIGYTVLAADHATRHHPRTRAAWTFTLTGLALNQITATLHNHLNP